MMNLQNALADLAALPSESHILLAVVVGMPTLWFLFKLRKPEFFKAVLFWIFVKVVQVLVVAGLSWFIYRIGYPGATAMVAKAAGVDNDYAKGLTIGFFIVSLYFVAYARMGMLAATAANGLIRAGQGK